MPQIDQIATIYASQLFWLVVVFALIYFGIGKAMLPKIARTVEDRNARISGDLAEAEAARASADRAEQTYMDALAASRNEAQAAAAKAKAEAALATEARVKAADAEIAARTAEAEARLAAQRTEAEGNIEAVAAEAAQGMASRIAGLTVSSDEAASAVKSALAA
jgi:F-type H+-transporting ATPase subunit b